MTNPAMLEGMLSRYSLGIKYLTDPGPDDAALRRMVEAALHAPDHEQLVPFRFKVVRGGARERLAELFAQSARDAGKPEPSVQVDRARALGAPVTVALVARIDLGHPVVPAHEQWCAVGGALANFMNAVHALGFAGKMLSGNKVRHPAVQAAFCDPGETLVGWVALGTPVREPSRGHEKQGVDEVLREWA
jgi:nitroreductase